MLSSNTSNLNAKYIQMENQSLEIHQKNNQLMAMLEQEKAKTKKLQRDFEDMVSSFKSSDSDKQQIKDNTMQALIQKN